MNPCTEVSTHGVPSRSDAAVVTCDRDDVDCVYDACDVARKMPRNVTRDMVRKDVA